MVMTIADLIFKEKKDTKKALDCSLELNERLLISNIYSLNFNTKGRRWQ